MNSPPRPGRFHSALAVLWFVAALFSTVGFCSPPDLDSQTILSNDVGDSTDSPQFSLPPRPPLPRLLVKFKSPMAAELESNLSLPTMKLRQPSPRVHAWLNKHQMQTLQPLYPATLKQKLTSGRSHRAMAEMVRDKFPKRAQRARQTFDPPEVLRTYVLESRNMSSRELRATLEHLRADPDVEFAQLDQIAQAQFVPNDPYFSSTSSWSQTYDDLYGVKNISCPSAWDTTNGAGVIVAIIDTGIDYRHRDITNQIWVNAGEIPGNGIDDDNNGFVDDDRGWDFIGATYLNPQPDSDPMDNNGHGTHVAGTVAAEGDNNLGVIGVAWGARVMAVRGLDDAGFGADSALANAIIYAVDNGADIINASWAGKGTSPVIEDAVNYAAAQGVVFVAAAGNASLGNTPADVEGFYPANLAAAIAVSASSPNDLIAAFSNFGYGLDVAAPGVDVLSLRATNTFLGFVLADEYSRLDGTSMAVPHVAGTAALILSLHPDYAPEEVRQVLRRSADRLMAGSFDPYSGYGRINAGNALAFGPVLQARMLSPAKGSVAQDPITVSGVATGPNFASYTLDYGFGVEPSTWTVLVETNAPVDHATLGTLETFGLADGRYTIRLRVFDGSGAVFEDHLQIVVGYTFITSPTRPPVPSVAAVHKPGEILEIYGTALGPDFQEFHVEWARGFNANFGWTDSGIALAGGGARPVTNDLLASWDTSVVTGAQYYTLRLLMSTTTFTNEARTMVYLEPDLYSTNWPLWMDQAPPYGSSVQLARDAVGSNILTLANGDYLGTSLPSRLWRFSLDGASVTNFALDHSYLQPATANVDGIAGDETVVAERHNIRVFRPDATSFIPTQTLASTFQYALPTLADLDGDGTPEILACGSDPTNSSAWLYAWKGDGQLFDTNYPVGPLPDSGLIPPNRLLPIDVDADGTLELLVLVSDSSDSFSFRLFHANGQPIDWPTQTFTAPFWEFVAGDLDNDGLPEIVLAHSDGTGTNLVRVFSADGTPRPGWPVQIEGDTPMHLVIADLDRDGQNEIIVTAKGTLDVLRADGSHFSGLWPVIGSGFQSFGAPVVGDINGDGVAEILVLRENVVSSAGQTYRSPSLMAYQTNGKSLCSWRLLGANGNQPYGEGNVVFGDFDGDGKVDLAVNYTLVSGGGVSGLLVEGVLTLFRLETPYLPHPRDWPVNFHDARNSAVGLIPARLRATCAGADLRLSWPSQPANAILQASDELNPSGWNPVPVTFSSSNGQNSVLLPPSETHRWYRLQYR